MKGFFLLTFFFRFYSIFFPNGVSARAASLKCCLPNGIPIIVMQSKIPKAKCVRQIHIPPTNIQMTFIIRFRHPPEFPESITLFPIGHKASKPNFNVCSPKGIPMIVIIITRLEIKYSTAVTIPPKINQIIFPKIFIQLQLWRKYKKLSGEFST